MRTVPPCAETTRVGIRTDVRRYGAEQYQCFRRTRPVGQHLRPVPSPPGYAALCRERCQCHCHVVTGQLHHLCSKRLCQLNVVHQLALHGSVDAIRGDGTRSIVDAIPVRVQSAGDAACLAQQQPRETWEARQADHQPVHRFRHVRGTFHPSHHDRQPTSYRAVKRPSAVRRKGRARSPRRHFPGAMHRRGHWGKWPHDYASRALRCGTRRAEQASRPHQWIRPPHETPDC